MTDSGDAPGRSLTGVAVRGVSWTWAGMLVTLVMQLAYTSVMSRLLEPEAFGLVAGAMIGLRFISYFSRFGIGSAVVQRESLEEADVRVALTLSVLLGAASALVAVLVAPLLAVLLDQPESSAVMRWMALGIFIAGLQAVPEALLRRTMRFSALATIRVVSFALGYLAIGIWCALAGWGVWSLVAATLTQALVLTVLAAALTRPPLRASLERERATRILKFGGAVSLTGFLEFLSATVDTLAVGRWTGAASLGQYSRASYLVSLPVEQLTSAASNVLLPSLSQVQSDQGRFGRGLLTSIGVLATIVVVPVAVCAAAAPSLVPLVLGDGWDAAAAVLPLVGAAAGLGLLTTIPAVAVEAKGAVGRKLGVQAVSLVASISLVTLVVVTGPTLERFAWAWLAGEAIRHVLYWTVLFGTIGVSHRAVAVRYVGAALLAVAAAAPVVVVVRVMDDDAVIALISSGLVGAALASVVWFTPLLRVLRRDVGELNAARRAS